jgi:beta-glucanase (GH16 family)
MTITFEKIGTGPKRRSFYLSARVSAFAILISHLFTASPAWAMPPAGYNLVWSDEFSGPVGSAPNPANWTYDTGDGGWGNNELENYTTSTNNSRIVADPNATDGSALALIAIDTQPGSTNYGEVGRYTSARLLSSGLQSFQYGYMEARIQMPYGDGIWPAYWMLGNNIGSVGWPACGEMDIMENIGNAADQLLNHGSLHAPNWNPTGTYSLPGGALYHNAYHTFGLLWQQDQVQFYVDGVLFETQTAAACSSAGGTYEFNSPFFFLLNMAVGGSWPGSPDASTSFPQTMLVDYVRVYQQPSGTVTPTPTPVVSSTWRVNAGSSQYTDSQGNVWSADENYTGGTAAVTTSPIAGALPGAGDQTLYQSQRWGNPFSYVFNVPAGSYQVTLKFAETYWTAAGDRVFNVSINGNTVLTNFDIFKSAGGQNIALDEVFNNIAPSSGAISIQFGPASADNAMVDAIQIIPMPSTPTRTPTVTATFTLTKTATPTWTASSTPTLTSTNTRTSSPTPSFTTIPPTATFTLTVTSTKTATASFTNTPVPPTNTPTNTLTFTGTITSTLTRTHTPVIPTSTPTSTATSTRTYTATNSMTVSATVFLTQTATSTMTATFTHTATDTFSSTATFTPIVILTPTETFTSTVSDTPTDSMTPTVTGTSTPSQTLSWTPSFTFTASYTPTPTHTFSPTTTFTPTSTHTTTETLTPAVTYTPTQFSGRVGLYPNPVTGSTVKILPPNYTGVSNVRVEVYTLAFRKIIERTYDSLPAGTDISMELVGLTGNTLANGVYYVVVTVDGMHATGKLLVLR